MKDINNGIEIIIAMALSELFFDKCKIDHTELPERVKEFEIIKNDNIDIISVNSIYDFYKVPFNEEQFNNKVKEYEDQILKTRPTNITDRVIRLQVGNRKNRLEKDLDSLEGFSFEI